MNIENKGKKYHSNSNLVYSCQYHVIFTPKYRWHILKNEVDKRLKEIIVDKQNEYDYIVLEMEVMPDHVHLLLDINPKIGVHNVATKLKGHSSRILREEFPYLKSKLPCLWTRSCFISSVGTVSLEVVNEYIENQKNK